MKISINRQTVEVTDGATLRDALEIKGIKPTAIATAVNGTVVPADKRASTTLSDGDKIVIIKAFYGG
ncbi:MAG: sulfur carrier protein ThiS [Bacteroides sp.]|nr:sulfur carrier protein ThiS [Bacteroides sp.]